MNTLRSKTKQVKEVRDLQKQSLEKLTDDYMVGLYNGLEMSTAILEGRGSEFLSCVKEPSVIESNEEQKRRTITSGIKRR